MSKTAHTRYAELRAAACLMLPPIAAFPHQLQRCFRVPFHSQAKRSRSGWPLQYLAFKPFSLLRPHRARQASSPYFKFTLVFPSHTCPRPTPYLPTTPPQSSALGRAGPPEDQPEVEVRLEDQQHINEFGRLNGRLHEVQDDLKVGAHVGVWIRWRRSCGRVFFCGIRGAAWGFW